MSTRLFASTKPLFLISLLILIELPVSIYFIGYSSLRKLRREKLTSFSGERSLTLHSHTPSIGRTANSSVHRPRDLPVPILENYLPNAYIYPNGPTTYNTPILAFLHNPKSGGTSIKRCIRIIHRLKHEGKPVVMATDTAAKVTEDLLNNVSTASPYYMGESVIGVCDHVGRKPCAYFTLIREPYERAISHYYYSKNGGEGQPPCNKTLEEFTLSLCSLFFRQLTQRILCEESRSGQTLPWQCENRPVSIARLPFNPVQRGLTLEYILQNLEKIFVVVGILEEFETSLKLFENIFGEPFHKKCRTNYFNSGSYVKNRTDSHQEKLDRELIRAEEKTKLMKNADIKRCLYEDIRIYHKMVEIFKKQKIIYNNVMREY